LIGTISRLEQRAQRNHTNNGAFVARGVFRIDSVGRTALVFFFSWWILTACSDKSPATTGPSTPPPDNSLEGQVKSLFPTSGALQDSALALLSTIRQQVALGGATSGRGATLSLVDFTLKSLRESKLNAGNSGQAPTSASTLVDGLYRLAGMDAPNLPQSVLTGDGTTQVVGTSGGTLVTPAGTAGVSIPAGTFEQPVLVAVSRLATPSSPNAGPLPTSVKQYPPYYEYATYPPIAQFGDSARVGVCQVTDPSSPFYPPEPHDRLRLAHGVGSSIEILERVGVDDFLRCAGTSALQSPGEIDGAGWRRKASRLASQILLRLWPSELYAAHGGLGGKVKSFSPFGAVDPTLLVVDPRSTFLLTNMDLAQPPLIVNLAERGIRPGDQIRLQEVGDWSYGVGRGDSTVALTGVFSSSSELLDASNRNRVPGAISVGRNFVSQQTYHGSLDTDIAEDFFIDDVTIAVPAGAQYLFVGTPDSNFADNTDADGDFGLRITKLNP